MIGQVGSAVDTAVRSVTVWQISLEGFGFCHLHHLRRARVAQLRAGTGRTAAVLGSLPEAALEHARKSRRRSEGVWRRPHSWGERKASQPVDKSRRTVSHREKETHREGVSRMHAGEGWRPGGTLVKEPVLSH